MDQDLDLNHPILSSRPEHDGFIVMRSGETCMLQSAMQHAGLSAAAAKNAAFGRDDKVGGIIEENNITPV